MFRRGPFRRQRMFRPRPMVALGERPRQMLLQANQFMDSGRYREAAEIFEQLAQGALNHNMLQRAPHLYIQAARAHIYSGQIEPGLNLFRQGMNILVQTNRWGAVRANGDSAVADLRRLGHTTQANQVQAWLEQTLQASSQVAADLNVAEPPKQPPQRLPAKCPFCGASLRPNEIEWLDDTTAECPYCGSSIPGKD